MVFWREDSGLGVWYGILGVWHGIWGLTWDFGWLTGFGGVDMEFVCLTWNLCVRHGIWGLTRNFEGFTGRFGGLTRDFVGLRRKFGCLTRNFGGSDVKKWGFDTEFRGFDTEFWGFDTGFWGLTWNVGFHMEFGGWHGILGGLTRGLDSVKQPNPNARCEDTETQARGATDAVGGVVRTRKASLFSLIKQLLVQERGGFFFFLSFFFFFFP